MQIREGKISATPIAAQDKIVLRSSNCSTFNIMHRDPGDNNAIAGNPCRTAVQIVLLNINSINRNTTNCDVRVRDIGNETCGIKISLDAGTVLRVYDRAVCEPTVVQLLSGLGGLRTNKIFVTLLLLFPPTDPIESPCPPSQNISFTVMLFPLVIATQSSWFSTLELESTILLVVEISNPSAIAPLKSTYCIPKQKTIETYQCYERLPGPH
jgi:hypothetical protein